MSFLSKSGKWFDTSPSQGPAFVSFTAGTVVPQHSEAANAGQFLAIDFDGHNFGPGLHHFNASLPHASATEWVGSGGGNPEDTVHPSDAVDEQGYCGEEGTVCLEALETGSSAQESSDSLGYFFRQIFLCYEQGVGCSDG